MRVMEVWAHRGASGYLPENTLESFDLAVRQGADGVELDVHLSRDGEMVVIHDEELKRVTGADGFVKDLTLRELKELEVRMPEESAGNGRLAEESEESDQFAEESAGNGRLAEESEESDRMPEESAGNGRFAEGSAGNGRLAEESAGTYRIPTLAEVLELVRPTGLKVNIELKNGIFLYEGLEEKVTALVAGMGMKERIVYSSFNHYSMCKIKKLEPGARTGLLICDGYIGMADYAKRVGADYIHPAVYHLWYPGFVQAAREEGLPLHVWTANEPEHLALVKAAGAEAVITNYPDRAIAFMSEEEVWK